MKAKYQNLFTARNGLILSFGLTLFLFLVLLYLLLVPVVSPPKVDPEIKLFSKTTYRVTDDVVTIGKPTTIRLTGDKLYDISADVQTQLVCVTKGVENTFPLGTTFSAISKGHYDIQRSLTIPVNIRIMPSDNCKIQSAADYIFYQRDRNGELKSIPIKVSGQSNTFKLLPAAGDKPQ